MCGQEYKHNGWTHLNTTRVHVFARGSLIPSTGVVFPYRVVLGVVRVRVIRRVVVVRHVVGIIVVIVRHIVVIFLACAVFAVVHVLNVFVALALLAALAVLHVCVFTANIAGRILAPCGAVGELVLFVRSGVPLQRDGCEYRPRVRTVCGRTSL